MPETLTELLADRTQETEEQILLSVFQAQNLPVTDWEIGGVARTMMKAIATAMLDKYRTVQILAQSRLVALAAEIVDASGDEVHGWLDLLGENFYSLTRTAATYTVQRCTLTCASGFGPIDINQGFTVKADPSGKRYVYQGAATVTVPDFDSVSIELTAEEPGADYADPAGALINIVTPLPGLTCNNLATDFGGLDLFDNLRQSVSGEGTGTITPSGDPDETRSYVITVVTSGQVGVGGSVSIEYYSDGVVTELATVNPIPATYTVVDDDFELAFDDGTGAGFIEGDVYTFTTPGTPIVTQGLDTETNAAYAARLAGRWPELSPHPVVEKYEAMVRQASLDGGYGISKVSITPSETEAGVANIVMATASGAPSGTTILAVQDYIDARTGITDRVSVSAALDQPITIAGAVYVRTADLLTVQAAADEAWREYIASVPIGGDTTTGVGVVRLAELIEAVMDAGAVDVVGLTIDGVAANYELLSFGVPVIDSGSEPSVALTWYPYS